MNDFILVIDDQPSCLEQIANALKPAGIEYRVEPNEETACALLQATESTWVIILRFASDHIDGIQLCQRLRSLGSTGPIHILMIVSKDAPDQTTQALDAGADDIIVEPFGRAELLTRCQHNRRRQTRRIEAAHEEAVVAAGMPVAGVVSQMSRVDAGVADVAPTRSNVIVPDTRRTDEVESPQSETRKVNYQFHPAEHVGFGSASADDDEADPAEHSEEHQDAETLIQPYFDRQSQRFVYPAEAAEFIEQWDEDPNVTRIVLDTILCCPECEAVPGFRFGCGECGSGSVEQEMLIHHFACACVGNEREFRTNRDFVCPKCRVGDLVAGTDFESLSGGYCCADCFTTVDQPELIGHCLQCSLRFPAREAAVAELVAYQLPARQQVLHRPRFAGSRRSKSGRTIHTT